MDSYISGHCTTNLDGYSHCQWPNTFYTVPNKGDYVESNCKKQLKVCSVTHTVKMYHGIEKPYIIIELNR